MSAFQTQMMSVRTFGPSTYLYSLLDGSSSNVLYYFRYFICTWLEKKGQLFFACMEVVIQGMIAIVFPSETFIFMLLSPNCCQLPIHGA